MDALIFIALLIIIVQLYRVKSFQKTTTSKIQQNLVSLEKELAELKKAFRSSAPNEVTPDKVTADEVVQWRPYKPSVTPAPPTVSEIPAVHSKPPAEPFIPRVESPLIKPNPQEQVRPSPPYATGTWYQKWLRNNPDLEKFIGENLINKIGIGVLVLGIAFFVKYAIDQNWIREAGRVSIGIGCGILLIGLAHFLRNSYRSFSSVLAGGGIAVLYFTIAFAFHEYRMFSQTTAFVVMILITIFAVLLSLVYDKIELAVIALIGGFLTPFLVSSGNGNYVILFSYLLILNIGMVALSWFKKWPLIHIVALVFTILIYGGWLLESTVGQNNFSAYKNGLGFATAFYFLFLGMTMVFNLRTGKVFKGFDFSLLLLITFSYYAAGMVNLAYWNDGTYQGLFTVAVALVNFSLALLLSRLEKTDKNILYLFIGLTITFVSLAAPVQLNGHGITLSWTAEFVLLYWLHQRTGIRIFKVSSCILTVCMLFSLLHDWGSANTSGPAKLTLIFTDLRGFIANIAAVIAFTIYFMLLRRVPAETYIGGIKNQTASTGMILLAGVILYFTCVFGVNLFFNTLPNTDVPNGWHQLITYVFVALFLWSIQRFRLNVSLVTRLLIIAAAFAMYLLSITAVNRLRDGVLQNRYGSLHMLVHWAGAGILLYLLVRAVVLLKNNKAMVRGNSLTWALGIMLVTFFSVEMMHVYVILTTPFQGIGMALQQYNKAGLTIVWALCSFAIMWLGMRNKFKPMRILSLVVFSLALMKLFLFDIRNISEGGKIAAFIMLGILLLIISFMYQKLKKMIIDDEVKK